MLTVNWWPGNLRPYESPEGFLARFCALNAISPETGDLYFDGHFQLDAKPSAVDIDIIAGKIGEDAAIVESMYWSDHELWHFNERWAKRRKPSEEIQYCAECLTLGYHSCLHKLRWLRRCPFHGTELSRQSVLAGGNRTRRRVVEIQKLLSRHSGDWRVWDAGQFPFDSAGETPSLVNWLKSVFAASQELQGDVVWESDIFYVDNDISMADLVGQLHAFAPVPDKLVDYLVPFARTWQIQLAVFDGAAALQLAGLAKTVKIQTLFGLYKCIVLASGEPSAYKDALDGVRNNLIGGHTHCRCSWGIPKQRADGGWIGRNPDCWPCCFCICPFEKILKVIERVAGVETDPPTSSNRFHVHCMLCDHLPTLLAHNLVSFISEPKILRFDLPPPADKFVLCSRSAWPCVNWIDTSALTELLDTMARFDLYSLYDSALLWLARISHESPPEYFYRCPVQLRMADDGVLTVVGWRRAASPS